MTHSFEIEIAEKYGVNAAIILHNIAFWINKNLTDKVNIIDGYCWTFITLNELQKKYYTYWKIEKIQRIISKLEREKAIKKGKYNRVPTNQTNWYTIIDPYLLEFYNIDYNKKSERKVSDGTKIVNGAYENKSCLEDSKYKDSKNKLLRNNLKESKDSLSSVNNITLNKEVLEIINYIKNIENSPFKGTRLRKSKTDPTIPDNIIKIKNYLFRIKMGEFNRRYFKFDSEWVEKNNINFNDISREMSWDDVFRLCKRSIRKYVKMFDEHNWPENKKDLTTTLSFFFYNSHIKMSWFLYALCNSVREVRKVNADKLSEKIFSTREKKEYERSKSFLKEMGNWDEFSFWNKIRLLHNWYGKWGDILGKYNQGNWFACCNNFSELLDRIKEFSETWKEKWRIGHFGINNKTWNYFISWMKKEKGVNMNPDKSELLAVIRTYENEGKKIKYADEIKKELNERR